MRAETREVETANIAVVVFAIHLRHVAVSVGSHEHVELLSHGVHLRYRSLLALSLSDRSFSADTEIGFRFGIHDFFFFLGN